MKLNTVRLRRRGSVIPLLAVSITVLFGFVALAIDLGMIILSRAAAQNAADTAALTGARTLDNRVPIGYTSDTYDNNREEADAQARASVVVNSSLNLNTLTATSVKIGIYDYDPDAQVFRPNTDISTKPTGKAWTAVKIVVAANQPSFFSRVFGINSLPTSATAVAAHRPRDIALVLDMSGSMKFSSTYQWPEPGAGAVSGLMNPDPNYPRFGHYQRYPTTTLPNAFMRTTNFLQGSNEIYSPTNVSMDAEVGPAIVRNFVFDPNNIATPSSTVATVSNPANLRNAFHRWNPPGMVALTANGEFGRMTSPTGWGGYNAFDTSNSSGPTPAPDTFATQTDDVVKYVGDRFPRKAGAIIRTNVDWDPTTATGAARRAWEVLFPTSVTTAPTLSTSTLRTVPTTSRSISGLGISDARPYLSTGAMSEREGGSAWTNFIDSAWEYAGYDLDLTAYNATSGAATPGTFRAAVSAKALDPVPTYPTNGRFHGYSMGPAYYGKTFFMWPPDPRWGNPNGATPLGTGVRPDLPDSSGVKDSNGNWICDWRRRFFLMGNSADTGTPNGDTRPVYSTNNNSGTYKYFHPEADNDPNVTSTQNINQTLLNTGTGHTLRASIYSGSTRNFRINYRAVLAWIKSGPQVLPPNLRAGRIKFYSSIPDHVDNAGSPGTNEASLDQRFWREYIDYVMGYTANNSNYDPQYTLAGVEGSQWGGANVSIGSTSNLTYTISSTTYTVVKPYMNYSDVPARPRMQFWFGPMSMLMFISGRLGSSSQRNWNPGTIAEAQTWQLKAGVRSALDDIKNNHPNDQVGMAYFAGTSYTTIRAEMGQDWDNLRNALYYPQSLLAGIKNGTAVNLEKRPYSSSFGNDLIGDLPNGNGSTDPVSGFALAYNLLSSASAINGTGRRGASKIVIFETDGVPNSWRNFNFTPAGANSYYTSTTTLDNSNPNGDPTSIAKALEIVDQIVAPTSSNGYSLENSDARVYPIAFGDLFSSTSSYKSSALNFLQEVAYRGKSSSSLATPLPAYQIITGTADQRIDSLKSSFERILQSGVQVTLIE